MMASKWFPIVMLGKIKSRSLLVGQSASASQLKRSTRRKREFNYHTDFITLHWSGKLGVQFCGTWDLYRSSIRRKHLTYAPALEPANEAAATVSASYKVKRLYSAMLSRDYFITETSMYFFPYGTPAHTLSLVLLCIEVS
jgi:hypothetical protein